MPELDNNGARIHYQLVGSGPPLLLIAGIASDGASWGPLVPHLVDQFRLILVDNRGSGRTRSDGPLSLEDMVADCAALLERLGIDRVDIVGHSMGGLLGLMLAATHPERVQRLVTLAAGVVTAQKRALFHVLSRLYFTTPPEDWFRLLYQWLFSEPFFASDQAVADAAAGSAAYPFRQSPSDFARQVAAIDRLGPIRTSAIACPVLAVSADLDLLAPPAAISTLHADVPTLAHATIPNAAHSVHWEAPDAVGRAIKSFLH